MNDADFQPGLRVSRTDAVVLFVGAAAAVFVYPKVPWAGLSVACVVGHFFLFCNVFRVTRALELAWVAVFLSLAALSGGTGRPAWTVTIGVTAAATGVVLFLGLRAPSYHGICWKTVNPGLRAWWDAHQAGRKR